MDRLESLIRKARYNAANRNTQEVHLLFYRGLLAHEREQVHNIKRAKVIDYILEHASIEIDDEELLVGRYPCRPLSDEEMEELKKCNVYNRETGILHGASNGGTGHRAIDYAKILRLGLNGILEEVNSEKGRNNNDFTNARQTEKDFFYNACVISINAVLKFAGRFRDKLELLASKEANPSRKKEYEKLADIFGHIPAKPARDFYDALQCAWFMQYTCSLADDITISGRPDQYLYPYYQDGIKKRTLTDKLVMELIENYYLKINEVYHEWPASIMLGGVDEKGKSAVNELTYMFVDAIPKAAILNPSVALDYRSDTPDGLLNKCVEIISKGHINLSLFNGDIIEEGLRDAGMSPLDARDFVHSTCAEITSNGCSNISLGPKINLAKCLEFTLNNGQEIVPGDKFATLISKEKNSFSEEKNSACSACIDIDISLDLLDTFEKFLKTCKLVLADYIKQSIQIQNKFLYYKARYMSNPLVSCFLNDCIAKGLDAASGGARYNFSYLNTVGFSTFVDSLNAVKDAVYEKKILSLEQLKNALVNDYEGNGYELIMQYMLNRAPKYGNDNDNADTLAVDLYNFILEECKKYKTCLRGTYHPSYFSGYSNNAGTPYYSFCGLTTAATPDGRKKGEVLSECIGPVQGMDKKGLTAAAKSVLKVNQKYGIAGITNNFRFSSSFTKSGTSLKSISDFIKTFMKGGGFQMQFNVVDSETLKNARQNPEKYRALIVRVAGYSAFFAELSPSVQEEIIRRTEHTALS